MPIRPCRTSAALAALIVAAGSACAALADDTAPEGTSAAQTTGPEAAYPSDNDAARLWCADQVSVGFRSLMPLVTR